MQSVRKPTRARDFPVVDLGRVIPRRDDISRNPRRDIRTRRFLDDLAEAIAASLVARAEGVSGPSGANSKEDRSEGASPSLPSSGPEPLRGLV